MIEEMFMRWNVATRTQYIKMNLDGSNQQEFTGKLPTDIGQIFGLTLYADSVNNAGIQLISTTQAQNLWLNIFKGATQVIKPIRSDDMLNVYGGSPLVREKKYLPVSIPWYDFSLDQSFINNPLLYAGTTDDPLQVYIALWYIPVNQWNDLQSRGMIYNPKHPDAPQPKIPSTSLPIPEAQTQTS